MVKFKGTKIGKRKILIKLFLVLVFYTSFNDRLLSQENQIDKFEEKAIDYFCENLNSIIPSMAISNVRFSGKSKGIPSSVINISDCIGEINIMKDSIPNKTTLDSLDKLFNAYNYAEVKIGKKCFKSTNRIFNKFNKSIYTLNLFNKVEYKGNLYIELFLINKKLRAYIVVLKFNRDSNVVINYYVKSRIY
ncbi:MAG: hypothetical protein M0Q90_02905 [Bacteroidales bacterium]|nr:hypothetical protein [Bacteroidales bacterium]